jgi:two-component system sensor histidine kinase UhpB
MGFTYFSISGRNVLRGLTLGFLLVLLLLGAAGWVAVRQSRLIREGVAELARDQLLIARLVHDVQMEENAMTEVLHRAAQLNPESADSTVLLRELDESDRQLSRLSTEGRAVAGTRQWVELEASVKAFTAEAHRVLKGPQPVPHSKLEALFLHHDRVVELVNELIRASSARLAAAEREVERESEQLGGDAARLLGASLVLALACALITIGFVRQSIQRLHWQSSELDRVSWHMLQSQEQAARRFSHELHDELGQSLAAVRSNLTKGGTPSLEAVRSDCLQLVDESIANVRELSQLLRPVILDDFGLDAGLRWLVEKFAQRTRLEAEFTATGVGRYADETETHLFRIAQEALTNVARHSGATRVRVGLSGDANELRLIIEDDGRGLPPPDATGIARPSLGMVGMRARARQSGGELRMQPIEPLGLRIEVVVPARARRDE